MCRAGCPWSAEPLTAGLGLGLGSWVVLGKPLPGLSRDLLQEETAGQVVLLGWVPQTSSKC